MRGVRCLVAPANLFFLSAVCVVCLHVRSFASTRLGHVVVVCCTGICWHDYVSCTGLFLGFLGPLLIGPVSFVIAVAVACFY